MPWVQIGSLRGPQGPPGTAQPMYVHIQSTLAKVWTVAHNLNKHPSVQAEDGAGTLIFGTVQHLSDSTLTITFAVSMTGRANCT